MAKTITIVALAFALFVCNLFRMEADHNVGVLTSQREALKDQNALLEQELVEILLVLDICNQERGHYDVTRETEPLRQASWQTH